MTEMFDRLKYALTFVPLALMLGCATTPAPDQLAGGNTYAITMDGEFDGYERTYRLHVPAGYRGTEPIALVVVLHGAFSTAAEMEQHTGFSKLADREGFVVVYPDGIGILGFLQHWNAGHCCGKAAADGVDDVGYVADVIDDVKASLNIDSSRIYMAGFSNGAMLTHRFAAERPEVLAAAAPLAGAIGSRDDAGEPGWQMPAPRSGVPMIMFHGQQDRRIPYSDTTPGNGAGGRDYSSVHVSSRFWWTNNGCESHRREQSSSFPSVTIDPGPFFTRRNDPEDAMYGFDASEIIWAFFDKHGHTQEDTGSS
jgi:polyhydroxybutyrate depolymerase